MVEIDATSPRIWVVDDDRSVRFVLSTALRDAGYIVEGFESTCAALQALAASQSQTYCSPTYACLVMMV